MGKKMKYVKRVTVNYETWKKIFEEYGEPIYTDDFLEHVNDRGNYWDKKDEVLMSEMMLYDLIGDSPEYVTDWKKIIARFDDEQKEPIKDDVSGFEAYRKERALILKYYSKKQYEKCLMAHEAEYDEKKIQVHIWADVKQGVITSYDNCYKYDINGAHNDALCEIFPKAAPLLKDQYAKRHEHPENKKLVNYYVGYLARAGFRKSYNWIVQRTTAMLEKAMDYCQGGIIYANTDGFIVWDPYRKIVPSKELGKFKLEYQGNVKLYQGKNYICFQYRDLDEIVTKGSVLCSVREKIDLEKNEVVEYDRVMHDGCYYAENIKTLKREVQYV